MERKIINFNNENTLHSSKRTTIYLPIDIQINRPTHEINQQLELLPNLYKIIDSRETYIDFYKMKILPLSAPQQRKSYQIVIAEKHWFYLNMIRKMTGLKFSEIVQLCFKLKHKPNISKY